MGRKIKRIDFKPLVSVKTYKELHHTCKNSKICTKQIQPGEYCAECEHYLLREVDVAENPIRHDIDWWN